MSDESKFVFFIQIVTYTVCRGEVMGRIQDCLSAAIYKTQRGLGRGRGCILVSDVGDLVQSDGIMNSEK